MKETRITIPELILVAGTRAAIGAGVGLLLADRLSREQRRAVGWTLFLFGAISTVPLALDVLGRNRLSSPDGSSEPPVNGGRSQAPEFEPQLSGYSEI